jgi:hypothetical protein
MLTRSERTNRVLRRRGGRFRTARPPRLTAVKIRRAASIIRHRQSRDEPGGPPFSSRWQVPATNFGSGGRRVGGRRPPSRASGRSGCVGSAQGLAAPSDHGVTRLSLSGRGRAGPGTVRHAASPRSPRCSMANSGAGEGSSCDRSPPIVEDRLFLSGRAERAGREPSTGVGRASGRPVPRRSSGSRPYGWCTGMKMWVERPVRRLGPDRRVAGVPGLGLWEKAVSRPVESWATLAG